MSDALSNYGENLVADYVGTQTSHIGLFTTDPGEDGSGTELSGNGYAREAISFSAASGGTIANDAAMSFGPASGANWGTVSHVGFFDALTGGNLIAKGTITTSGPINDGEPLDIAIGGITYTQS